MPFILEEVQSISSFRVMMKLFIKIMIYAGEKPYKTEKVMSFWGVWQRVSEIQIGIFF